MRVNPLLKLGVLASALALPGAAYPLGLGRLTVQSSIGQPLSAQIALTSAAREELDSLTVKIADPSLYRQNNLTYNGVLSRARVTLERGSSGEPYLRITTQGAVNEPYLDLMVEANWASGRLVREYTFLLDPPGALAPPVDPVAPARIGAAPPRPAAPPAAAPAPAPAAAPGATGSATVSAPPPPSSPREAAPGAGAGEEYQVKRGDTLSKIAKESKPPSATLEQMMVALFNANQRAFEGGNMNRLRAGSIVTVPSADAATATPPAEAQKVVRLQASDWRTYRDRVAGSAPASDASATRTSGGRIGAAAVDSVPAAPPGRDQLKVSREVAPSKAAAAAANEEAVARDRQIREAQQRIAELEKTLTELQRAVSLKNQAMADLQAKADAAKAPAAKAPEPKVAEAPKAEPAKVAAATPPAAAPVPKAAEAPKVAEAPKGTETPKAAEAPKPVEPPKAAESAPAPAPAAPKVAETKAAAAAPAKPEPSFIGDLMGGTPTWAIGGGALVVLGGIAAMLAARRRKSPKYEDGIIADTDIKTNTVFGSTGGGVVNTGDNSLSSEFSREGLGSIDTDEVDPIAEAEVYLAYGRDAQAEEILRHALRKDPQRQEVYLKLLEIHAQHNKPSAFETVASELFSVSQGKGETWQKALALGRQLDPSNPMFAEAPAREAAGAAISDVADASRMGGKPAGPARADDIAFGAATAKSDGAFDLRLDEDLSIMRAPAAKSPTDILAGAQSELEKTAKSAAVGVAAGVVAKSAFGAGAGTASEPARVEPAKPAAPLDFRLDSLDFPHTPERTEAPAPAARNGALDLDKLDLAFDRPPAAAEDPTPSVLDGQWHDAATKLDLAKAYQEMGDVEGAREILQEVLREGDDKQKHEAKALIDKLA